MGFTDFFKKSKSPKPAPPTEAEMNAATADFIEVESYSGVTFHAVPNQDRQGAASGKVTLCGYEDWIRTPTSQPIDAERMKFDSTGRHWHYCPKCRDALIAIESGSASVEQFPDTSLLDLGKLPSA